jgi:hypothetical protein
MDDHQRGLFGRMLDHIDAYESGRLPLPKLVQDLRGLFDAANPRELSVRDHFEDLWSVIDGESELRTEPWAPPGAADDQRLAATLGALRNWAASVANGGT